MFIFEHRHEREGQNHGVTCENQPYGLPVGNAVLGVHLNHFTAHDAAEDTAEAVSHHQEHPLRTGANCRANFFFDKHRTRDVEEVECATVNDHRQYQQYMQNQLKQRYQLNQGELGEYRYFDLENQC